MAGRGKAQQTLLSPLGKRRMCARQASFRMERDDRLHSPPRPRRRMMDLLERYLAEVRRNLPTKEADDITAELRDVLLERAEEQEETTGKVDWNSLLQEFGHPLVVAARYRKQQWLVGP